MCGCVSSTASLLRSNAIIRMHAELAVADVVAVGEAYREGMAGNGGGVVPIVLVTGRFSRAPQHTDSVLMKLELSSRTRRATYGS